MPAFVKTDKDEELWARAKERAKEQGRAKDWAYVTSIYKSMKGGKVGAMEARVALVWRRRIVKNASLS
jgi:hypothetical protein